MQERRSVIRVKCFLPSQYAYPPDSPAVNGHIADLSVRGLGLLAGGKDGEPGQRVQVSVLLPSEEEFLTVQGIIRWTASSASRHGGYPRGIEFVDLDETQRYRLQTFVTDSLQQSRFQESLTRTVERVQQTMPSRVLAASGLLLSGVLVAGLCIWIVTLQRQSEHLRQVLAERARVITQLETRHQALQQELDQTKGQLARSFAEITQFHAQTARFETDLQWFSQNLSELTQAYLRLRDEREQLTKRLAQVEQQHVLLEQRWQSIPELRTALRQAYETRRQQLRAQRRQWLAQLREEDQRRLMSGNRGYVMKAGQPTLTSSHLSIRVYTPEPSGP